MFSRRHYVALAAVVRALDRSEFQSEREAAPTMGGALAKLFAADNPAFDRERFRKACYEHA